MISQLVNRDFVLAFADATRAEAEAAAVARQGPRRRRSGPPDPLDDLDTNELRELTQALAATIAATDAAVGATNDTDPAIADARDDLAFIPDDPLLSIVQSVLEEYFEEREPDQIVEHPTRPGRRGGGTPMVTNRALARFPLERSPGGRRLWKPFEVGRPELKLLISDPKWLLSGVAMAYRAFKGRAPFVASPPTIPIEDDARILLVGDWGTGLPRAQKVADQMRRALAAWPGKQYVVHLGDVYYSGTKREYETRFLRHWPVGAGDTHGSFALNANHDMYTGGHAYYGTCLADPRFQLQAGCSYFVLENAHWQILGLDSGYEEKTLHGPQAEWATQVVNGTEPGRRTCLLSHHQLFSAHENGAVGLGRKLQPVLQRGVDAWFWGHEHRCIQYSRSDFHGGRVGFASCVGHGGVPEYLIMREGDTEPPPWQYEYTRNAGSSIEPWETFGFAIVELNGPDMRVRYVDEDGREHHTVPSIDPAP